jgi:hypothetical protein
MMEHHPAREQIGMGERRHRLPRGGRQFEMPVFGPHDLVHKLTLR